VKGSLRLLTVDLLSRPNMLLTIEAAFEGAFEGSGDVSLVLFAVCFECDECLEA